MRKKIMKGRPTVLYYQSGVICEPLPSTPCPEKKTDSILVVTSTNLDIFSYFFGVNHPDNPCD